MNEVHFGARAGIRTRVGGMKTHYDGPGYTTRAPFWPTDPLFITVPVMLHAPVECSVGVCYAV